MANSISIAYRLKRKILTFTNKISRSVSAPDPVVLIDESDVVKSEGNLIYIIIRLMHLPSFHPAFSSD